MRWKPTDGGVVDVVVGGDHAQVERHHVHLVLDADALGLLQVGERLLHQLRQVVRQVTVGHSWRGEPSDWNVTELLFYVSV